MAKPVDREKQWFEIVKYNFVTKEPWEVVATGPGD
jgi:hypothetical protein